MVLIRTCDLHFSTITHQNMLTKKIQRPIFSPRIFQNNTKIKTTITDNELFIILNEVTKKNVKGWKAVDTCIFAYRKLVLSLKYTSYLLNSKIMSPFHSFKKIYHSICMKRLTSNFLPLQNFATLYHEL